MLRDGDWRNACHTAFGTQALEPSWAEDCSFSARFPRPSFPVSDLSGAHRTFEHDTIYRTPLVPASWSHRPGGARDHRAYAGLGPDRVTRSCADLAHSVDRQSVVSGKSGAVLLEIGGRRHVKKKNNK